MLSFIAVTLLATTPTSHSLLTPTTGRSVSAHLLVAQAPETSHPEEDLDARIQELTLRVSLLQSEIRGIDTNWPAGSLVMAYSGYVLSPLLLLGIPLILIGLDKSGEDNAGTWLALGAGMTVGGVAGVGLLIAGVVTGAQGASVNRARREELVRQRIQLEDELREVRARRDARGVLQARSWTPRPGIPLVAFAF